MTFDPSFFKGNLQALKAKLPENSLAVFFSDPAFKDTMQPAYRPYIDRNFYYLTGLNKAGLCFMTGPDQGDDTLYSLDESFVHDKYERRSAGVLLDNFHQRLDRGLESLYIFSYGDLPCDEENKLGLLAWKARQRKTSIELANSFDLLKSMRAHKRPCEVAAIERACTMTGEALSHAFGRKGPVAYEYEIAADLDHFVKRKGYEFSFKMVAAGANSLQLHYLDNDAPVRPGDLVLVDAGTLDHLYTSDISRTYPIGGSFSPLQARVYDLVLRGQKKAETLLKPGSTIRQITEELRQFMSDGLLDLGLCQSREEADACFPHNIGHPVGLYVHDPWGADDPIVAENVYTLEPGLYLEKEGFGIRIEDCYWVGETSLRCLSSAIPKERSDIEAMTRLGQGR